jgi:hypothetical protein
MESDVNTNKEIYKLIIITLTALIALIISLLLI